MDEHEHDIFNSKRDVLDLLSSCQVGDRLFSAFGQDTIDALFWTATEPRNRKRETIGVIPHFALAATYVFLHTLLVLLQG